MLQLSVNGIYQPFNFFLQSSNITHFTFDTADNAIGSSIARNTDTGTYIYVGLNVDMPRNLAKSVTVE